MTVNKTKHKKDHNYEYTEEGVKQQPLSS